MKIKSQILARALVMAGTNVVSINNEFHVVEPIKEPKVKCKRINCNNLTNHKKGYCCAEHYILDKQ